MVKEGGWTRPKNKIKKERKRKEGREQKQTRANGRQKEAIAKPHNKNNEPCHGQWDRYIQMDRVLLWVLCVGGGGYQFVIFQESDGSLILR